MSSVIVDRAPSRRAGRASWALGLVLGATMFAWAASSWKLLAYDEGLMLTGALRMLHGEWPHRDFYANYAPGQFALLATTFKLFGLSVGQERVVDTIFRCGIVVMAYATARRALTVRSSLAVAATVLVWLTAWGAPSYPVWPCLLLILLSAVPRPALWVTGALAGATAWFRYDVAVFTLAAHALFIVLARLDPLLRSSRPVRRDLGALALGAALPMVPLLVVTLALDAGADLWWQVVQFPSEHYAATRRLPWPGRERPEYWVVYLPLLTVAAMVWLRWRNVGRWAIPGGSPVVTRWREALLFTLLAACLFAKGVVRVSPVHAALAVVPALLAIVMAWGAVARAGRLWPWPLIALTAFVVLTAAIAWDKTAYQLQHNLRDMKAGFPARPGEASLADVTGRRADRFIVMDPDAADAARYVKAHSAPDERLFVGNGRHDRVFVNDASFYFLVERLPATRWHHFDPDLQNSLPVQQDIVRELDHRPVRWVVRTSRWDDAREPNDSARSSGVVLLDHYLDEHYTAVHRAGRYSVWKRTP